MSAVKALIEVMKDEFNSGLSVRDISVKHGLPFKTVFMILLDEQENLEGAP